MRTRTSWWPLLWLVAPLVVVSGCTSVRTIDAGRVAPNQSVELRAGTRPFVLYVRGNGTAESCPTFQLRGVLLARVGDTLRLAVSERQTSSRDESASCAGAEVGYVLNSQSPGMVVRATQVDVVKSAGAPTGFAALVLVAFFVIVASQLP